MLKVTNFQLLHLHLALMLRVTKFEFSLLGPLLQAKYPFLPTSQGTESNTEH